MGRILAVMFLGAALFLAAAWQLGLLDSTIDPGRIVGPAEKKEVAREEDLGKKLYASVDFPEIRKAVGAFTAPIVLRGNMNPREQEEVPAQVSGRILFIGEQVDESAVLVAGSAPFLAEPYYFATVYAGRQSFVKFYRRLYDQETVTQGQMLAMIEPARALGQVLEKIAKISAAEADVKAAAAAADEGYSRERRAFRLKGQNALAAEDYGAAYLTMIKLNNEFVSAKEKVKMAEVEKDQADVELNLHEIRATLPYKRFTIKNIARERGSAVKPGDTVMLVQSLERLQAEALIEEQDFAHLKDRKEVRATIEPTIVEKPLYEFPGHDKDVTSVAVSKDMKIVSGSEDKSVCVWKHGELAPLRKLEHDDQVRVVACTPVAADKNICLAGCANGSIYLWDLDGKEDEPIKIIPRDKAHGTDASITSLAFSLDGKFFASGASDGSIRIWSSDGTELYPFAPENGVAQSHEDAVTSLHFTPQCRLVSAGRDKTLRVWRLLEKGAVAERKAVHFREGNVPNLGVSQDGKWMLFDQGRTLKLLSVESHTLKHTLNMPSNSTPFETLALFSPDNSLILAAGAAEGRLQLWRTPDADSRGFEVRQFAPPDRLPIACAAFSADAGKGGANSFAVSASGHKIHLWTIPTPTEVSEHREKNVRMTLVNQALDPSTKQTRIGFEVANPSSARYPNGRFEAGRTVTIVIE